MKRLSKIALIGLAVIMLCLAISGRANCFRTTRETKVGSSMPPWLGVQAPANLTATLVSYTRIDLSWTASYNADGYELERSTDGTTYYLLTTTYSDTTFYSDPGPFSLTTYYYRVRAMNTIGDRSNYSNIASVTVSPPTWLSVSAGEGHSLALTISGTIWSWGWNQNGQLGLNDYISITTTRPAQIGSETDWSLIEAGWYTSFAIKNNRTLWAWGLNDLGQLGLGDTDFDRFVPEQVGIGSDWNSISGGGNHALAIKTNGTLWAWGGGNGVPNRNFGQLGLGDTIDRYTPAQIGTDSDWAQVTAGYYHSLGIKTNSTLWAWGYNYFGQLGDSTKTDRTPPRQVGTDSDWILVSAGYVHTIGIKTNATLWGWGYRDGSFITVPTQIGAPAQPSGGDSDWIDASAGGESYNTGFTIARKTNLTIWSWGYNAFGQLGLGDILASTAPFQITYPAESWSAVAAGGSHSLGLTASGELFVWGRNNYGQLGLGYTADKSYPINLARPQPTNLVATVISWTQVSLSWIDNSSLEIGFIIERSVSPTTGYSLLATVGPDITSYSDPTVTRNNTYYYRVKATYASGDSGYSNVAFVITCLWGLGFAPKPELSARYAHAMVWDPVRNQVIMFGGSDATYPYYKNDLWCYDPVSNTWTNPAPGDTLPSARSNHAMVWDPVRNQVIMFGGDDGSYKNDLWCYDPVSNTWTNPAPSGTLPSARGYHAMVWDPVRNQVIMFGGFDATYPYYKNDLWCYDPVSNTWTNPAPGGTLPSARYGHAMVWDPVRNQVIMFGGNTASDYKNDLWCYDPVSNTWTVKTPVSSPSARIYHAMVWDGSRAIMFGGYGTSPTYKNDLWCYDPAGNTWTNPAPGGTLPSARSGHAMVWDPVRNQVIMFGGSDASGRKNDLWWWW